MLIFVSSKRNNMNAKEKTEKITIEDLIRMQIKDSLVVIKNAIHEIEAALFTAKSVESQMRKLPELNKEGESYEKQTEELINNLFDVYRKYEVIRDNDSN